MSPNPVWRKFWSIEKKQRKKKRKEEKYWEFFLHLNVKFFFVI